MKQEKKKLVVILLCLLILPTGCQGFLNGMSNLFTQLLPLAIQYAPYALMFMEKEDNTKLAKVQQKSFDLYITKKLQENPKKFPELTTVLKKLQKNNRKIYALKLQTLSDVEKAKAFFAKLSTKGGSVKYVICHLPSQQNFTKNHIPTFTPQNVAGK